MKQNREPVTLHTGIKKLAAPAWATGWFALGLLPFLLHAQTSPAPLPDLKLSTAGNVTAVAVQPDGKVIIGGTFTSVNDVAFTNLARLNPNGSVDISWQPAISGPVSALAISGANVYVGGSFVGGVNGLVRISVASPAVLDTGFVQIGAFSANALALDGTNLYVGGSFGQSGKVGGFFRTNLLKLDITTTGAVDSVWAPNPNGTVRVLTVNGTNLFAGGDFTSIGSQIRTNLAKVSMTGAGVVDPSWNPNPMSPYPGASGLNIYAIAASGTNVFVAGEFTNIAGTARLRLAKLGALGNGAADPLWIPSVGGYVKAIVATTNSVFLGGDFFSIANQTRYNLAKLSASGTGTVDTVWSPATDQTPFLGSIAVQTLLLDASGLYAGGSFHAINGTVTMGITKLDPLTGQRDRGFTAQAQIPGKVLAIARQSDGRVIVGGDFWFAGVFRDSIWHASIPTAISTRLGRRPPTASSGRLP